jgi:hypothetical protein
MVFSFVGEARKCAIGLLSNRIWAKPCHFLRAAKRNANLSYLLNFHRHGHTLSLSP